MNLVIAIDGPSGSGKSSTSRGVARQLSLAYLDTGAMYRAMTWALLRRGIDVNDTASVAAWCDDVDVNPGTSADEPTIHVDGHDVTEAIRSDQVTTAVSAVSAVPAVRARLVAIQQSIIEDSGRIVAEGRDIGSVVAPEAQLKIYLVADPQARAQRRAAENRAADVTVTGEQLARRDQYDSSRAASPLEMPVGATCIDSTNMSLTEVIAAIIAIAETLDR